MDDLFQDVEGVLVSLLSGFVGLDIDVSGVVNVDFVLVEVSKFLNEVFDGDIQRFDFTVESVDVIVDDG